MFQTIVTTAIAVTIAFGLGGTTLWRALESIDGIGAFTSGPWRSYPLAGTRDADPYTKARIAREAELPLGAAEGLTFVARRDSGGAPLRRQCRYAIEGDVPSARLWTLFAGDDALRPLATAERLPAVQHSQRIVHSPDGSMRIATGPIARPGNWLAHGGAGPMVFVLSLYDTTIASSSTIQEVTLPRITLESCDD